LTIQGLDVEGLLNAVHIAAADTPVSNPAFDVTPNRLVTAIITETGIWTPTSLADRLPKRDE